MIQYTSYKLSLRTIIVSTPKPISEPAILNQITALMKLEASFLSPKDLSRLSNTCVTFRKLFRDQLNKFKTSELLEHVLNIDEKRMKRIMELLSKPYEGIQSSLLIRTKGRELRKENKKIITKKLRYNISPLEAAALCGDFFLLRLFKEAIPKNQEQEAGQQLLAIRKRSDFLSEIFAVRDASKKYDDRAPELRDEGNSNEIDNLLGQIGDTQTGLSTFVLQVYCNPVPFKPLPDFDEEPRRSCVLYNGEELDLASIGSGTQRALYKGQGWMFAADADVFTSEFEALDHLCQVISKEIDKIICELLDCDPKDLDPGSSYTQCSSFS